MPALSEPHAAAIRACVALLEAFYADISAAECRERLRIALESAMDATGMPRHERPDAAELIDCFDFHAGEMK
jgi:hypothetical protein